METGNIPCATARCKLLNGLEVCLAGVLVEWGLYSSLTVCRWSCLTFDLRSYTQKSQSLEALDGKDHIMMPRLRRRFGGPGGSTVAVSCSLQATRKSAVSCPSSEILSMQSSKMWRFSSLRETHQPFLRCSCPVPLAFAGSSVTSTSQRHRMWLKSWRSGSSSLTDTRKPRIKLNLRTKHYIVIWYKVFGI